MAPPSHLLLNGGKLYVRPQDNAYFLAKYAGFVTRGARPCVVELRTPVFRLMMDLDIKREEPLPREDIMRICVHIHRLMPRLFPGQFLKNTKRFCMTDSNQGP